MVKKNSLTGLLSPVFFCFALLASLVVSAPEALAQTAALPAVRLTIGHFAINAEVATTEASRQRGLMYRSSLAPDQGMLFVFDEPAVQCFWMKNTPLPLSIAFIDGQGTILNITDMQAQTTDIHCPTGPILYALEMQQGWFAGHRIGTGLPVTGLPRQVPAQ
jgi:uncharacterized membrane protein (UPF0127 family)